MNRRAAWTGLDGPQFLLAATVVGLLIRLLNLGGKSLWLDEAFNIAVVKTGLKALWTQTFETHHPPLHFILQKLWMQGGEGEFWLRLLPALCGAAAVPLVYFFGKKVAGKNASLTAAGLVALSPLLVWYSQDFRPYSFVVALGLAAMTAAVYLFLKPGLLTGIVFAVGMVAAFYTHYALLSLIPLQILLIVFLKTRGKIEAHGISYWLFGLAAAGIAFFPWLKTPAARAFFSVLKTGSYPGQMLTKGLGIGTTTLVLLMIAAGYLVLVAGIHVIRWSAEKRKIGRQAKREGAGANVTLGVLWLVFLGLSVMPRGYSIKKQIALFVPYGMLLIGCGWPWERTNRKKIAA
ncbi:MAG: glycosyltransferase family 39 protein, partial [Candidatus Aminicenantes bacterium]|nr:glycosyltransferase family 39 protein [Candidatus Aminicenantes bacterium]